MKNSSKESILIGKVKPRPLRRENRGVDCSVHFRGQSLMFPGGPPTARIAQTSATMEIISKITPNA